MLPRVVSSLCCGDAHWAVLSTIATSSLPTLAPLPALLGVQFCVVPLQLGVRHPHDVPQEDRQS